MVLIAIPTFGRLELLPGRYYATGMYTARIDGQYDGLATSWTIAVRGTVSSGLKLVLSALKMRRSQVATNILSLGHYAGSVVGLLGLRSARYASKRGNEAQ